jgi:uncharacterized membrane protein YqgA involved in biofilm formation
MTSSGAVIGNWLMLKHSLNQIGNWLKVTSANDRDDVWYCE